MGINKLGPRSRISSERLSHFGKPATQTGDTGRGTCVVESASAAPCLKSFSLCFKQTAGDACFGPCFSNVLLASANQGAARQVAK